MQNANPLFFIKSLNLHILRLMFYGYIFQFVMFYYLKGFIYLLLSFRYNTIFRGSILLLNNYAF